MGNPFAQTRVTMKDGDSIDNLRLGKSNLQSIASNGEFNAHDKKELMGQIGQFMQAMASGELVKEDNIDEVDRRAVVASAMNNPQEWEALGSSLAEAIEEQASREGFLRRIMQPTTLKQGETARIPLNHKEAEAIVATSPTELGYQLIRGKVFTPDEFEIKANVRVAQLDIDQISGDLLDQAYNDGMEAIMVKEDRLWKAAADRSVGTVNPVTYIQGELTPKLLATMKNEVAGHNLPVTQCIMSYEYWEDFVGNSDFTTALDPVHRYDLVANGMMGSILGMNLLTDGYRDSNQRVLKNGEIYVIADPKYHGGYTTRGGVRSNPTDGYNSGETNKGWLLHETFSMILANVRSVSKGVRI